MKNCMKEMNPKKEAHRKKVIIDTDIGDDADDALAICLALKSPELELLGITTVFRNTAARAKIAVQLLKLMGREDIPVYAGMGHPLVAEADVAQVPIQLLAGMETLEYQKDMDGVEYLRQSLEHSEGDITLVTIGPLTNIAVLLRKYPGVKDRIREIVMMGGAYYMHYTEWNILCDPEAADIVFSSGVPIRAIGLDVTTKCQVNDSLVSMLAHSKKPETELLVKLLMCYYENRGRHTFLHDPMAVFAVYDKELLTYQGEDVHVELHGRHTRGMTFNKWKLGVGSSRQNVLCAKEIKAEAFVEKFKEIILR